MDELTEGRITAPKLCVLLNPQGIDAATKAKIAEKTKNSTVLWVDLEGTTVDILRQKARVAGVHLYTKENCNVWANGPFVVLHGAEDGEIHFQAKSGAKVYDYMTGKKLSGNGQFDFPIKKGETRIFRCGKE